MNREFLKSLGLSDENIESIMKEHGKAINPVKEKADKVDGFESQIEDYKQQITDRDKQLNDLSEKAKGNEALTEQISQLKEDNKKAATEWEQKLETQQKDFAIESALRDAKAKNPKIAKNALDVESISLKDGKLIGFDEQMNTIKESDAYLFGEDEPAGIKGRQPHITDPHKTGKGTTKEQLDSMGYMEQVNFKNENPEQYKSLVGE